MAQQTKTGHRQRLRDRFLAADEAAHTDEAILELLLTFAIPQRDVQPLAKRLLQKFGTLAGVLDADIDALCQINGLKSNSAVLLKLARWIQTHCHTNRADQAFKKQDENKQPALFEPSTEESEQRAPDTEATTDQTQKKPNVKHGVGLFSKAALKEAIALLPTVPDTDSLNEVREYFSKNLHYNSEQTRYRYAHYIIRRMFPNGRADRALRLFAKHYQNSRDLREVCFYRFVKTEPLMPQVIEELLLPNLGAGQLTRDNLKTYLAKRFPSLSTKECSQAIVDGLRAGGVVKADRLKLSFGYRDIPLPAFAFVLHSEFPEPGMYDIAKLETNSAIRVMLWNPDRLLPSLYELRNRGIISKVSEIDTVRQFTTKWKLEEVVEQMIAENLTG